MCLLADTIPQHSYCARAGMLEVWSVQVVVLIYFTKKLKSFINNNYIYICDVSIPNPNPNLNPVAYK